jgi:predicted metal-dependent hydrolase
MTKLIYGKHRYEYKLVHEERKTLSLTVNPDLTIVLKAPLHANQERIEAFLKRKWLWLEKQLNELKKYQKTIYPKDYLSGEGFLYLGKQYKLQVSRSSKELVKLKNGILLVQTTKDAQDSNHNQMLIDGWYKQQIEKVFKKRYTLMLEKFSYDYVPQLVIRKMPKRWGSFVSLKKIILNPELIKAPTKCLDYVITHELCHMIYKNHNRQFYELISKKFSGWELVKEDLELRLG